MRPQLRTACSALHLVRPCVSMLVRSAFRHSVRRSVGLLGPAAAPTPPVPGEAINVLGEKVSSANLPGFGGPEMQGPPPPKLWGAYLKRVFTTPPTKDEIIEGIGYPGQKGNSSTSSGGMLMLGRLYYGPGRYDYGRPVMPKSWIANYFYGFWEFFHLFFVADRWIFIRALRHIGAIAFIFCFFEKLRQW